jgi:hypothetical protein
MTGDHGIGAAATWRRDATTIKATVMQNDHSRARNLPSQAKFPGLAISSKRRRKIQKPSRNLNLEFATAVTAGA